MAGTPGAEGTPGGEPTTEVDYEAPAVLDRLTIDARLIAPSSVLNP